MWEGFKTPHIKTFSTWEGEGVWGVLGVFGPKMGGFEGFWRKKLKLLQHFIFFQNLNSTKFLYDLPDDKIHHNLS